MDKTGNGTAQVALADIVALRQRVHDKYLEAQRMHREAADLEDELKRLTVRYTEERHERETVTS